MRSNKVLNNEIGRICEHIPWSTDGRCGPENGNAVCNGRRGTDDVGLLKYCSQYGWCGETSAHQRDGQKDYNFPNYCNYLFS